MSWRKYEDRSYLRLANVGSMERYLKFQVNGSLVYEFGGIYCGDIIHKAQS